MNVKIVSEYDQEVSQSQTADKPMASWGRAIHNRDTSGRQTKQINQLSHPPSKWLQNKNWHKVTHKNHRTNTETHNSWIGITINKEIKNNRTTALERTAAKATGGA